MRPFAALSHAGQVRRLRGAAQAVLPEFGLPPGPLRLVGVSENAVFELRAPQGRFAVRVHRTGYHSAVGVASELAWLAALGAALGDRVPAPRSTAQGGWSATTAAAGLDQPRQVSVIPWMPGRRLGSRLGPGWARAVGELTAHLHLHARHWAPPARFERPVWDAAGIMGGAQVTWRPPELLPGLTGAERRGLEALRLRLTAELDGWPRGPEDAGLIHADLHGFNVLLEGGRAHAIDFDDCGYGWWWADAAVALRPGPRTPDAVALLRAWAAGYRQVAPLPHLGPERLPALWAARRIAVGGWFAADAREDLRERYLDFVLTDLRWLLQAWPAGAFHRQAAAGLRAA
ncbi:MAG: phosphotransferase [Myxococcales bacterium]|nr:phosphotransferase [Myxococcales bacterium]